MPLLLLRLLPPTARAAAVALPALLASSPAPPSRLRASHISFAFPRLRKYGRRHVAATSLDDDYEDEEETEAEDGEYEDEDDEEMAVDEEEFLATRPKPMGFGEGKTYSTDVEEQLLREMGLGGARRGGAAAPAKRRPGDTSANETDISNDGVQVRLWNLPKKKNIQKDLKQAFKGFPGLLSIDPAVSASKKTRDPICKGFAYIKLESAEAATRFIETYSRKTVAFGKVEKPINCCIVDARSSVEPLNKESRSLAISKPS